MEQDRRLHPNECKLKFHENRGNHEKISLGKASESHDFSAGSVREQMESNKTLVSRLHLIEFKRGVVRIRERSIDLPNWLSALPVIPMRSTFRVFLPILRSILANVWILLLGTSAGLAQERNVVESGKRSSALVEVTAKSTFATAFCIDQDGLFVTNFHVVDNLQPGEPIKLILNANEQNEFALQAKVVHVDQNNDLALLKVQDIPKGRALEALPLASDPKLFETMDVLAFGFPFGVGLSTQQATYPSISVNAGKITAVRKQQGKVILVQLDAVLNPGNSGGPVLNDRGQVIGIVSFGLAKTGVNFAIPVERLSELIRKPSIDAIIPDLTTDLDAPKKVEVTLIPFQEEIPEPTVEFWIKYGDSKSRKFELKPNGKYRFQGSVLVRDSNENSSQALRVNIQFPGAKSVGRLPTHRYRSTERRGGYPPFA